MNNLVEYAPGLAIATVTIGLFGYAIALMLAAFFSGKEATLAARLSAWFTTHPAQNIGIPCAAISAFAIVAVLLNAFPPSSDATGQLEFKVFGLEFSGPSGSYPLADVLPGIRRRPKLLRA